MLKIYTTSKCVTVHLTGTEWDAIRFYTPKLLRKLNNQIPGCKNFGIHAPGHDPYSIKGTIFEKMMMPYNFKAMASVLKQMLDEGKLGESSGEGFFKY